MLTYTMCVMHAFLTYNCVKNFIWKKKIVARNNSTPHSPKDLFFSGR